MSDAPPAPPADGPAVYPAYGQQTPGYYAPPTNALAIVSLVLSVAGIFTFVTAIAGVICGHLATAQITRSGEGGRGFALAGVITGYVVIALFVVVGGGLIALFIAGVTFYNSFR